MMHAAASPTRPIRTAITGGIGSGKSVVSRMLYAMGYKVYDCDCRARAIMNNSAEIKQQISEQISAECITEAGEIDRRRLGEIVFADAEALDRLNGIVHSAVRHDFERWCREHAKEARLFVETAILSESGFDRLVDDVWEVTAPEHVRIERVMRRNGLTAAQVKARIESQRCEKRAEAAEVVNDGITPLLPRIELLLGL